MTDNGSDALRDLLRAAYALEDQSVHLPEPAEGLEDIVKRAYLRDLSPVVPEQMPSPHQRPSRQRLARPSSTRPRTRRNPESAAAIGRTVRALTATAAVIIVILTTAIGIRAMTTPRPPQQPSATVSPQELAVPEVRHQGIVYLNSGSGIDLDTTDPGWGEELDQIYQPTNPPGIDLELDFKDLTATGGAYIVSSSGLSYQACSAATGYGSTFTPTDTKSDDGMICMRTGNGRIAAIHIIKIDYTFGSYIRGIDLTIEVWQNTP